MMCLLDADAMCQQGLFFSLNAVHAAAGSQAEWDQLKPGVDASLCPPAGQRWAGSNPMQYHSLPRQNRLLP